MEVTVLLNYQRNPPLPVGLVLFDFIKIRSGLKPVPEEGSYFTISFELLPSCQPGMKVNLSDEMLLYF